MNDSDDANAGRRVGTEGAKLRQADRWVKRTKNLMVQQLKMS